ncbi:MAG TPA: hypothetical protein VLE72_00230 [Candidatus Saccharimonadales bacterium]|nr:hypothetical protein [Candidatus Saccharimonadales bacterium]
MTLSYIAIGLQLITAWVPFDTELNGITGLIHHYVAITEAVLLIPLLWMVANSPVLPASIRFVVYCIALVMVGFIPLGFKTQKTNRFLAVQAGYVSCFHLAVIISLLYVAIN